MNRYYIFSAVLVIIIVAGAAYFLFLRSSEPPSPVQEQQTQEDTSSTDSQLVSQSNAVRAALKSHIPQGDQTVLYNNVISGNYALQIWRGVEGGGQALLKYDSAQGWTLVSWGGGEWSVSGLVQEGVSQDAATTLVAGVSQ